MALSHGTRSRPAFITLAVGLAAASAGCLSEGSYPLRATDLEARRTDGVGGPARGPSAAGNLDTRAWLKAWAEEHAAMLPGDMPPALASDQLVLSDGRPADVFGHFGIRREGLPSLFTNLNGVRHTANACSSGVMIDPPPPDWPDFTTVWIPIDSDVSLCCRIGFSRAAGAIRDAPCLVIQPGFFGDNGVLRTRDLAAALVTAGFHVAAVEMRGHGQTEARYPNVYYRFGAREVDDLMRVSDWLMRQPHVTATGLIGFCWSANTALLAAWFDGRDMDHQAAPVHWRGSFVPPNAKPRFGAGIIAFSAAIKWEETVELLDKPISKLIDPAHGSLQGSVMDRAVRKDHPEATYSLRKLIAFEFGRTDWNTPEDVLAAYDFLRLLPHKGRLHGADLNRARVPVLIVHGANDPLMPAQWVADLMASVSNRRVAALVLPGGGHVGFCAWDRRYYFNLIVDFFR